MFFTFPEDTRWNAERQAVEFEVEIGEYHGVVRVPRRVFQLLLPETPTRERCVEAYYLQRTRFESIAERKTPPAAVDRGRECGGQGAGSAQSARGGILPTAEGSPHIGQHGWFEERAAAVWRSPAATILLSRRHPAGVFQASARPSPGVCSNSGVQDFRSRHRVSN